MILTLLRSGKMKPIAYFGPNSYRCKQISFKKSWSKSVTVDIPQLANFDKDLW